MQTLYLIVPLAPLAGAILAGLAGRLIGRKGAHSVTIALMVISFGAAAAVFRDVFDGNVFNGPVYTWLVSGDVRCDDVFVQLYASDASIYEIRPLGVVRPRSLSDVVAVVQYAAENKLPVHPRGAGTGLAGGRGVIPEQRLQEQVIGVGERLPLGKKDVRVEQVQRIGDELMRHPRENPLVQYRVAVVVA